MKKQKTLLDENGIELIAEYYQYEDGTITLYSFEVVIAGLGIDIFPQITPKQRTKIISLLNDE